MSDWGHLDEIAQRQSLTPQRSGATALPEVPSDETQPISRAVDGHSRRTRQVLGNSSTRPSDARSGGLLVRARVHGDSWRRSSPVSRNSILQHGCIYGAGSSGSPSSMPKASRTSLGTRSAGTCWRPRPDGFRRFTRSERSRGLAWSDWRRGIQRRSRPCGRGRASRISG